MANYLVGGFVLLYGLARVAVGIFVLHGGVTKRSGHRPGFVVLVGLMWCSSGLLFIAATAGLGRAYLLSLAAAGLVPPVIFLVVGAWRIPAAVRLIGDPNAWTGERQPDWARPDEPPR